MKILVLNSGSSSIKYQLIDMDTRRPVSSGLVERIGQPEGAITHKFLRGDKMEKMQETRAIPDHTAGLRRVAELLTDPKVGVISDPGEIKAVGHRMVHGGEYITDTCLITPEVEERIKELFPLAPLHNPPAYEGYKVAREVFPAAQQIAVFDTAFHQTMPPVAYRYALPEELYTKYGIRKYGFHGTSHKYVAQTGARLAGLDFENSKIITCHIGNGASVTAVLNGKSHDTSMGFSPVDGLVMGTRCGNVDPSAITFIGEKEGMSYAEVNEMMNKKSGVLGLTDLSSDMRDIDRAYDEGNPRAILARDMHYGRIRKFVGEYAAEMGSVDLIVFTGGVGENSCEMRETVCTGLEFMGVEFDRAANKGARGVDKILSKPSSRVKVAVIATDEELVIATDTYNLVK